MTEPILPAPGEVARYVPVPGSIVWRRAGDARVLLAAGYALLLQVAHPTVGAGVREFSDFRSDPWGRLLRTLDYVNVTVYGGPQAAGEMGRRVRAMHKTIKGVDPAGRRYSALEPEAYAWVHATLAAAIVNGHARFGRPLRADQLEQFWAQWRDLGRVVGVRERDLPVGWAGFQAWFDEIVADRLEDNDVAHSVLATLATPARPPLPILNEPAWRVARIPVARLFGLATVGMLPPVLRHRMGLRWSTLQETELRVLGAAARASTPVLPGSLRVMGPGWLRWRGTAIARGEVASVSPSACAAA